MKLLFASSVLLAAGAASGKNLRSHHTNRATSYARSIAGLKALQKLSQTKNGRDLQLFDTEDMMDMPMFQFGAANSGCGETCKDDALCSSFMTSNDLEATCSAGCVPQMASNVCEQLCSDGGAGGALDESALGSRPMLGGASQGASPGASGQSAATAEQRFGFLDAALNMACANCNFYECCTNGEEATGMSKYDACQDRLPDPESFMPGEGFDFLEDWDMMGGMSDFDWDSLFPEDWDAWGPGASQGSWMGPPSDTDQGTTGGRPGSAVNLPALDLGSCSANEKCASLGLVGQCCPTLRGVMLGCCDGDSPASPGVSPVGDLLLPEDWDTPIATPGDSWAGPGDTDHASGTSLLGQLFQGIECPDGCDCEQTIFSGIETRDDIEDACNSGCLPMVTTSCEAFCGDESAPTFLLCDTCNFLSCCGEGDAEESRFAVCEEFLPSRPIWALLGDAGGDSGANYYDQGATWGGSGSAVNLPALDLESLFDGVNCPDTCKNTALCGSIFTSMGDQTVLAEACDASCLPTVTTCDQVCGNMNGPESMAMMADLACDTCKLLMCCATDSFATCEVHMPVMADMPYWDMDHAHGDHHMDWNEIEEALAAAFDQLSAIIQDVVGDASMPEFCQEGNQCPIEGFCDIFDGNTSNFNLASIDYEKVCSDNALFLCGPTEFEEMCTEKCSTDSLAGPDAVTAEARTGGDFAVDMFCSLCDIATCCRDKDDATTFEDCALGAVPQEVGDAIESATGDGSSSSSTEGTGDETPSASIEEDTLVEEAPSEPSAEANGEASDTAAEDSDSEPLDTAADPEDSVPETPTDPNDPVLAALEREDSADSGSGNLGTAVGVALASLAAATFVSI